MRDTFQTDRLPQSGYMPLTHAASWSGVSVRTMRRWLAQGLPFCQVGPRTKVLISPDDLTAFLTKHQQPQLDLDAIIEETMKDLMKERI